MLKTSTRIFAASTMAALLIGINTGAFACDKCAGEGAKTSTTTKSTKPVKTLASAKIAPETKVAPKVAPKTGVKLASLTTKNAAVAKTEAPMCAKCEAEAAAAKK